MPDGHPVAGVVDGQQGAGGLGGRDHAVGLGERGRQRLLAEDPLHPGFGRVDGHLRVGVVPGGDGDDVGPGLIEHLAVVAVHLQAGIRRPELLLEAIPLLFDEVASGHHLGVVEPVRALSVAVADPPAADYSNSVHLLFSPVSVEMCGETAAAAAARLLRSNTSSCSPGHLPGSPASSRFPRPAHGSGPRCRIHPGPPENFRLYPNWCGSDTPKRRSVPHTSGAAGLTPQNCFHFRPQGGRARPATAAAWT